MLSIAPNLKEFENAHMYPTPYPADMRAAAIRSCRQDDSPYSEGESNHADEPEHYSSHRSSRILAEAGGEGFGSMTDKKKHQKQSLPAKSPVSP
jgi:hypothetical protein